MAPHERLSKIKALAMLSSVAYASEEILLLLIDGVSYRQTIRAYPAGSGSHIVAKDNLGEVPALTAGGALLVDYILTVAVSVASAVAALVSVFPAMNDHRVSIGIDIIVLVTMLNLRGIR